MVETIKTDYVIIGSGSAGSTIAYRLAEKTNSLISVIEFGGSDKSPIIQMPAALSMPMNMKKYNWGYNTLPEKFLNNRQLACPRGKVIGGSSSINGMIFVRGNAHDFDAWDKSGAKGWSYSDVLPYFKKMETFHGNMSEWRGNDGPMHVSRAKGFNPLYKAFLNSSLEAGYNHLKDYNGFQQEGFGFADMTVWKGRRWSAANAYLHPAIKKGNTKIYTKTLVDKIIFEGKIAREVECIQNGRKIRFKANFSIILCAGAIGSPLILQRSGIGSSDDLKRYGIDIIENRPGVGHNLQDHLEIYFQVACSKPITLYKHYNNFSKSMVFLKWLFTKKGLGATNHFEVLGFVRSNKGVRYPDIQFHFLPIAASYDGKINKQGHGFQLHVGPMRSKSRGYVKLSGKDPKALPKILFNYLSDSKDLDDFRKTICLSREILSMPSMEPFYGYEISPGKKIKNKSNLDEFIKNNVESAYHPCGTCKMGSEKDKMSVVAPNCKVIGVENLYCADSSIFPIITNGNLNAPTIMVAEKASDHILENSFLKTKKEMKYTNPNWKKKQK